MNKEDPSGYYPLGPCFPSMAPNGKPISDFPPSEWSWHTTDTYHDLEHWDIKFPDFDNGQNFRKDGTVEYRYYPKTGIYEEKSGSIKKRLDRDEAQRNGKKKAAEKERNQKANPPGKSDCSDTITSTQDYPNIYITPFCPFSPVFPSLPVFNFGPIFLPI